MHEYTKYLNENTSGFLHLEQKKLLKRIIAYRILVGFLMFFCFMFLAFGTGIPLFLKLLNSWFFWLMEIAYIAGMIWGLNLTVNQIKNRHVINSARPVNYMRAIATKTNRAVAIPNVPIYAGGMMLLKHLQSGIIKLKGKSYGTLPSLYKHIEEDKESDFFIVNTSFGGIKGIIVNYR